MRSLDQHSDVGTRKWLDIAPVDPEVVARLLGEVVEKVRRQVRRLEENKHVSSAAMSIVIDAQAPRFGD